LVHSIPTLNIYCSRDRTVQKSFDIVLDVHGANAHVDWTMSFVAL